jgi:PTS system nitrogen regulatory IIA component
MSTGIGFNVAVPHVRLDSVSDLVMAVGISGTDILDYESLDEQPIRIVCMLAARSDQHAQYLKTLGTVSTVLKSKDVRDALMAAPDEKSAFLILTQ